MEKLQRDFKSMVDNVAVPSDKLNETVHLAITIGKKQKKRFLIKKQNVIASVASIFILIIGGILFTSYSSGSLGSPQETSSKRSAESIPLTESILNNIGDVGLQRMAQEGKVKNLSLVAEGKGIKVFLQEGYLDNQQMAISYRLEFEDSKGKAINDSTISVELLVNGVSKGESSFGGMDTKELSEKGGIFTFYKMVGSSNPAIGLRINSINQVEGNWDFSFDLQKEDEYFVISDFTPKEDGLSNYFSVNTVKLSPSKLELNTTTKLKFDEKMPTNSYLHISVIAQGPDGYMYFADPIRQYSNDKKAYEQISTERTINEILEIPRGINSYSYKIVPFMATYKGKELSGNAYKWDEISAPFSQGAILEAYTTIKVIEIKREEQGLVVHYEMDSTLPFFPVIVDREDNARYAAISFKKYDNYMEVTYPKVENADSLEFVMYDASYKVFSDLEVGIDLK